MNLLLTFGSVLVLMDTSAYILSYINPEFTFSFVTIDIIDLSIVSSLEIRNQIANEAN